MISLNNLKKITRKKTRVGRGISAGRGKTAGRGTKGQKSRNGHSIPVGFEGGQTPLKQRLPKMRGFNRHKNISAKIISLDLIAKHFKNGEEVSLKSLKDKGLIRNKKEKLKIVAGKSFKQKLKFNFVPISKAAEMMVKKAGGEIIWNKQSKNSS